MRKLLICILAVLGVLPLMVGCENVILPNSEVAEITPEITLQISEETASPLPTDTALAEETEAPLPPADETELNTAETLPAKTANVAATASAYIGEAAAKAIALQHAGVNEADLTFVKSELEREDGRMVYDISFYKGNTEYDYEIDAITGEIRSFSYDIEKSDTKSAQSGDSSYIGLEEAKKIALKKAGLSAAQITYTEAELDYEDGIAVYQISFVSGSMEYEFEINAVSGAIIEYEKESIYG